MTSLKSTIHNVTKLLVVSTLILAPVFAYDGTMYNTPSSPDWPGTGEWLMLYQTLSPYAELSGPFTPADYEDQCGKDSINTFDANVVAKAGRGLCMQYPSCANLFCLEGQSRDNLPAYSLKAKVEMDLVRGLQFANQHNIQVTIKSTGHSAMGGSTAKDSLLIWLAHFELDNAIKTDYSDSCNDDVTHDTVIGINAGQNFDSIAKAVGDDYHFVSASELTVGASGGWILGNGLSFTSRHYGLGIDNVVDFRLVLPSGAVTVVDRCTNPDLFWALRGGGGGTFGVVSHMNYKLHPKTPIVHVKFRLDKLSVNDTKVDDFIEYWVHKSQVLDTRWGARFASHDLDLFFAGNKDDAKTTFLDEFDDWVRNILDPDGIIPGPSNTTKVYDGWSSVLSILSNEMDDTGGQYVTESTFSRIIPNDIENADIVKILKSLIFSESLSFTNFLLGGKVNAIEDSATSVHAAMRKSVFVVTTNRFGYVKLLETLPNNVTGSSKNHHGGLEPEWRQSLWGNHYDRLSHIKDLVDPKKVLNCYQSVGYVGDEVDFRNVAKYLEGPPVFIPVGQLDITSAAPGSRLLSTKLLISLTTIGIFLQTFT